MLYFEIIFMITNILFNIRPAETCMVIRKQNPYVVSKAFPNYLFIWLVRSTYYNFIISIEITLKSCTFVDL
jgi:uncharacterized protein YjaZ